jgi:hypothetical protein
LALKAQKNGQNGWFSLLFWVPVPHFRKKTASGQAGASRRQKAGKRGALGPGCVAAGLQPPSQGMHKENSAVRNIKGGLPVSVDSRPHTVSEEELMKKLVTFSLLLMLLASAVFAQVADGISIGAWGRGAFAPFIGVGERKVAAGTTDVTVDAENFVGSGVTWGNNPSYRFDVVGSSDYVGFGIGIASDGGIAGNDTGAHVWAKPFSNDWLKITLGNFNDDKLRGKIGSVNGGFEYFVLGLAGEEDAIFTRFNGAAGHGYSNTGFLLSSAPVEGLYIGAALHAPDLWEYATTGAATPTGTQRLLKESFKRIQIGLGYEIGNVGLVRAQFIGGETNGDDALVAVIGGTPPPSSATDLLVFNDPARIEAAFAFTGAEGLTLDVGLKFWLPVKAEYSIPSIVDMTVTSNDGLGLSLGASFNSGAFGITGRVDTGFASGLKIEAGGQEGSYTGPFTLNFHVVPSFDLGFATVGLDLGLAMSGATKQKWPGGSEDENKDSTFDMGFGGFIAKGLGNGSIKAGLAYTLPRSVDSESKYHSGVFTIPVILEYSF